MSIGNQRKAVEMFRESSSIDEHEKQFTRSGKRNESVNKSTDYDITIFDDDSDVEVLDDNMNLTDTKINQITGDKFASDVCLIQEDVAPHKSLDKKIGENRTFSSCKLFPISPNIISLWTLPLVIPYI